MAKEEGKDNIVHVRPRKGNEGMKAKLQEVADKEGRYLNEVTEKILLDYLKNPHKLDFSK